MTENRWSIIHIEKDRNETLNDDDDVVGTWH